MNETNKNTAKQYSRLLVSTLVMMGLQFAVSAILTRILSPADYSVYKLITNYGLLLQSCLTFGIPVTLSFLLTNESLNKKEYIGYGFKNILWSAALGMLLSYLLLVLQMLFNFSIVDNTALYLSPLCLIPLMLYYTEYICIGTNDIKILSRQKISAPALLICLLLISWALLGNQTSITAIAAYTAANLLVTAYIFSRLGLSLSTKPETKKHIRETNRTLGLQTYIGSIFSVISARFFIVLVAAFVSDERYALYTLAVTISAPLGPFMSTLGSVMYKRFAQQEKMSRNFILLIVGIAALTIVFYSIGVSVFSAAIFGEFYTGSIYYSIALGIGAVMVGTGDIFNRFIMSKGNGKYIRNCAIATGIVNIVLGFLLIAPYNITGITISGVASNFVYLALMAALYVIVVNRNKQVTPDTETR